MPALKNAARENAATAAATREVTTISKEVVPVDDNAGKLGMHWREWFQECTDEELALTKLSIARLEPVNEGHLVKLGNDDGPAIARVDDEWIRNHFGGGRYAVKVYVKPDRSQYDTNVRVAGPPKPNPFAAPAPAATAAAAPNGNGGDMAAVNRLADILERVIDREREPKQSASGTAEVMTAALNVTKQAIETAAAAKPAPAGGGENALLSFVLDELKESRKQVADMMRLFMEGQKKGGSLIEQVKELSGVGELLGWSKEKGGATNGWDIVRTVSENLPEILEKLPTLAASQARPAGPRAPVPIRPAPGVPTSAQAPAAPAAAGLRVGAPAPAAAAAQPAEVVPPAPPGFAGVSPEQAGAIVDAWQKAKLVEMISTGADPGSVLTWLEGTRADVARMLHAATDAQIRLYLQGDPILAGALQVADFEQWLAELRKVIDEDNVLDKQTRPM
jgi:hypothetical protein